ncbi:hypothetical protein ACFL21_02185 [Patescibacteria group bacterium]
MSPEITKIDAIGSINDLDGLEWVQMRRQTIREFLEIEDGEEIPEELKDCIPEEGLDDIFNYILEGGELIEGLVIKFWQDVMNYMHWRKLSVFDN